jgi:hypothetical protein
MGRGDVLGRYTLSKLKPIIEETMNRLNDHENKTCPGCNLDVSKIALVNLVYSFEVCYCRKDKIGHLVETAWHKSCFVSARQALDAITLADKKGSEAL